MENHNIGPTFRELRNKAGLSVPEVLRGLEERGLHISDKTLYAYENGTRAANADMFVALCELYKCNNVLEVFSNVKVDYSIPTDDEWQIIETYRNLDVQGKETVRYIMTNEKKRVDELKITKERIAEMETETSLRSTSGSS